VSDNEEVALEAISSTIFPELSRDFESYYTEYKTSCILESEEVIQIRDT
jgi:hypothetical protein